MKQTKKIIKLTESDLYRIVNSVLNEEINEMELQSSLFNFLDEIYSECRKKRSKIDNKIWIYYEFDEFHNDYATIVIEEKYNVVIYDLRLLSDFYVRSRMDIDVENFNKLIVKWVVERLKIPVNRAFQASSTIVGSQLRMLE